MNISITDKDYDRKKRAEYVLYEVLDPELMVNVIDLGLVWEVDFFDDTQKVHVLMTLTSPHCPMGDAIKTGVTNTLEREFPGFEIEIELTFEPAWSFDMVSAEGKAQLQGY
jgi:metal-sulfur cluster biosynthetic enzyme